MATGSFSSHWISYLYNIKCSSPAEKSLCCHKWKAGPVHFVNGDWMFTNLWNHNLFHRGRFITVQLSKCLSVNSSRLYVQNFVLPVFATFPKERSSTRRALSLTKCLTNRGLILYSSIPSRKAFVDEQVISLRTRSLFPLSILRALYIIYFQLLSTLMLKPITTWKSGCGVLKFLNRSKEQS